MSEIKALLEQAGRSADAAPSAETVEADVLRGRAEHSRMRRRRAIRSSALGVATACVDAGALAIGLPGPPDDAAEAPRAGSTSPEAPGQGGASNATGRVRLVAYTGNQLDGFIVDRAPKGWFLQGSSEFALTIAPDGDKSHPDNFVGKLVVMLLSQDAKQSLPKGEPVEVGGGDAVVRRDRYGAVLTYEDAEGRFVQIQSPKVLGWANDELARFAEGVEVTVNARAGLG